MSGEIVTLLGVAHPWMGDTMGHMNVRYYMAMFDDASFQLLGRISSPDADRKAGLGWADVRCEIDYKHETPVGTLLTVTSAVLQLGTKSLTYEHTMSNTGSGVVHAVARITSVRFDLAGRRAVELAADAVANASSLSNTAPSL